MIITNIPTVQALTFVNVCVVSVTVSDRFGLKCLHIIIMIIIEIVVDVIIIIIFNIINSEVSR